MIFSNLTLLIWLPYTPGISGHDIYTSNRVLKKLINRYKFRFRASNVVSIPSILNSIPPDQVVVFYYSSLKNIGTKGKRTIYLPPANFVKNGLTHRNYVSYKFTKSKTFYWLSIL